MKKTLLVCLSLLIVGIHFVNPQATNSDDVADDDADAESEGMSIDDIIINAANSSTDLGFFSPDNKHVKVEYDIEYDMDDLIVTNSSDGRKRSVGMKKGAFNGYRWQNNRVPYDYSSRSFSSSDLSVIRRAMNNWSRYTCLTFPYATSGDRIYFRSGSGCSSMMGRRGNGRQNIKLARGCRNKGTILHEIAHALGVHHEQTRPDRDKYVTIISSRIDSEHIHNFDKHSWDDIINLGIAYDYNSIMHYSAKAFGDGEKTIITKDRRYQKVIGQREVLSFGDILTVNIMYDCSRNCKLTHDDCPNTGFVGKDCKCWCPGKPYVHCQPLTRRRKKKKPDATKSTSSCKDVNRKCSKWKSYCTSSNFRTFMTNNCAKTCGVCVECVDKNKNCVTWASGGHCVESLSYMTTNCRKSCDMCNLGRKAEKTCKDYNSKCYNWGKFCSQPQFLSYMKSNCPRTCGYCRGSKTCFDSNQHCRSWAKKGKCSQHAYVKSQCRLSCGKCRISNTRLNDEVSNCADNNEHCGYWAKNGDCSINDYTKENCKLSCGLCKDQSENTASCKDSSEYCTSWAREGNCSTNTYVKSFCRKACGFCQAPDTECKDHDKHCHDWAANNECTQNPDYMLSNCKASCGKCPDYKPVACMDENKNCAYWASQGKCQKNSGFMLAKCRLSCGQCAACVDEEKSCADWASNGECEKNPGFMLVKCKISCGQCVGSPQDQCVDLNKHCGDWEKINECTKNPEYMLKNCKKSCGACSEKKTDHCQDRHKHCVGWAENGECTSNSNYMLSFCKKSCDACDSGIIG